jgi:hypothetical protein
LKPSFFKGRRSVEIRTKELRLTATEEGGQVAELLHLKSGVSPLYVPTWPSIEPSEYSSKLGPQYGENSEARLVASLLGHSICLDLFGAPGPEEVTAGIPVHGEASIAQYNLESSERAVLMSASLPKAQMAFQRRIALAENGLVHFCESIENIAYTDRPIGWTQHVTLGAPFLEGGTTHFSVSAKESKVSGQNFNDGLGMQQPDAIFEWPFCPRKDGAVEDLRTFTTDAVSGGFTAHRMDPDKTHAFFIAWSERFKLAFGYVWRREDFPWLSRWEENHLRPWAPWNSQALALGMEFGVSPMVESRREMVERGRMFDTPTFRWIPARTKISVQYCAFLREAAEMPRSLRWDGCNLLELT